MADPFRRQLLIGGLAAALAPGLAFAAAGPSRLLFSASRNGHRIGQQQVDFERQGDAVTARTLAEFTVKIGPLAVYRYRHQAVEQWDGDVFVRLETHTDQNGKALRVTAERSPAGPAILNAAGERILGPATAAPFSHWNRQIAGRPLFNPQDGMLLRESASAPQAARVRLANGADLPATRIVFRGEAEIQDFYDQAGTWTGLIGKLKDGSTIEYRRL